MKKEEQDYFLGDMFYEDGETVIKTDDLGSCNSENEEVIKTPEKGSRNMIKIMKSFGKYNNSIDFWLSVI